MLSEASRPRALEKHRKDCGTSHGYQTPLFRFLESNGIGVARLADVSGISRQHINRLKSGRMEPTRPVMLWITEAACYIVKRRLEVGELFDLRVEINEELLERAEVRRAGDSQVDRACDRCVAAGGGARV